MLLYFILLFFFEKKNYYFTLKSFVISFGTMRIRKKTTRKKLCNITASSFIVHCSRFFFLLFLAQNIFNKFSLFWWKFMIEKKSFIISYLFNFRSSLTQQFWKLSWRSHDSIDRRCVAHVDQLKKKSSTQNDWWEVSKNVR